MQDQHNLKPGIILQNYEIIRVLGEGGFGITYLAKDRSLGLEVVIKECFPNEFAIRSSDKTITAKSNSISDFSKGKRRFKEEAQILAKFNHPSIVKILGYFEANNTAYFIMEYEEGIDLAQYMKEKGKPFTQEEILTIMMPILEGLKEVHRYNYLHRDIKPGNILIRKNHAPVLIDFGATRVAVTNEQSKSVTSMLTEGYAPFEQYSTDLKRQGPFTDLYSIGAVIYKMITLDTPISSQTRAFQLLQNEGDPLQKLQSMDLTAYDDIFLKAIDKSLENKPNDRQNSVEVLQSELAKEIQDIEKLQHNSFDQVNNILTDFDWRKKNHEIIDIINNNVQEGRAYLKEKEPYIKKYIHEHILKIKYYLKEQYSKNNDLASDSKSRNKKNEDSLTEVVETSIAIFFGFFIFSMVFIFIITFVGLFG